MGRFNPLAIAWLAFLIVWKSWPQTKPLEKTYALLSLMLLTGVLLIVCNAKNSTRAQALALLPFFAVAIWARIELGRNWIAPTEIINTGPYAVTKHPIYYSVFGAALLSAIMTRSAVAFGGAALIGITFPVAAAKEEKDLLLLSNHSPIVND